MDREGGPKKDGKKGEGRNAIREKFPSERQFWERGSNLEGWGNHRQKSKNLGKKATASPESSLLGLKKKR